ncbi:MAG TPA: hypothetical protein VHB21_02490 [Minicystis sp.]|nr:hypothetical protein [Minicystis sp.]
MDPRTLEINNLRVLNDYLNQTIDVLTRSRNAATAQLTGLGHSPYTSSMFGAPIGAPIAGNIDPTLAGLSHTPATTPFAFGASPFGSALSPFGSPYASPYASVVDPWNATRGLSHSPFAPTYGHGGYNPVTEMIRQQQIQQAAIAQQLHTIATLRAMGVPV